MGKSEQELADNTGDPCPAFSCEVLICGLVTRRVIWKVGGTLEHYYDTLMSTGNKKMCEQHHPTQTYIVQT